MAKGDESFKRDVASAVEAGSDFSQGGDHAHKALMAKLAQDAQKDEYKDPAKFNKLGESVAEGLRQKGTLDEHAVRWTKDNMHRFDTSGDKKIDYDEIDPKNPIAVNGFEKAMMGRLQEMYSTLNKRPELDPLIGSRSENHDFSQKDFKKLVEGYEKPRSEESDNRQQSELAARKQAQKEEVAGALLRNDGDPRRSLAAVLDTQRADKPDGEISRKDVRKFIKNFDDGESRGDFGYNRENLRVARLLDSQWDDDLGKSLRGQYDRAGGGREHNGQPDKVTHGEIDLKRLAGMRGQSVDDMWASNASGTPRNERAVAEDQTGVRAVQADSRRPVKTDNSEVVDGNNRPVVDGNGQPVRSGETSGQRRVRPLKPETDDAQTSQRPNTQETARRPVMKETNDGNGERQTAQRPVVKETGDGNAQRPVARYEAPKPIPELVMPEIKAGEDVTKVREAFAKSVEDHFKARADYTVQPGQGWDRIARDVLRQEKDGSHSNEQKVVGLSEALAKSNGWGGRLDQNKMLHPGDIVHVMSPEVVKARVEATLKQFDAKALEIAEAAKKKAEEELPSQFEGKRNGEGVVDTTPKDTTAVTPPVVKDSTVVTPPVVKDTTVVTPPVGKDTTAVTPPVGKDTTVVTPPVVKDTPVVAPPEVKPSILSRNVNPEDDAYVAPVGATQQSERLAREKATRDRLAREKADKDRMVKSGNTTAEPDFSDFKIS